MRAIFFLPPGLRDAFGIVLHEGIAIADRSTSITTKCGEIAGGRFGAHR